MPRPVHFEIPAETLDQAVTAYGEAVQEAFAQALEELEEMRRKAASSIVIPKGGAASLSGLSLHPSLHIHRTRLHHH